MSDVGCLALSPGRLRALKRVRTCRNDLRDSWPEIGFDLSEPRLAALILGRVVHERCDRVVFVASILDDEAANAQQVPDIRDFGNRSLTSTSSISQHS